MPPVTTGATRLASRATSSRTSNSSISVKPRERTSPLLVARAVERDILRRRANIVDVAPAPGERVGLVLVAAQDPLFRRGLRLIGERIARDSPQILAFAALGVAAVGSVDQHLQRFRIPVFARGGGRSRDLAALPVFVKRIHRRPHVA